MTDREAMTDVTAAPGPVTETFATPDDFGDLRASQLHASLGERIGAQAGEAFMGGTRTLLRGFQYGVAQGIQPPTEFGGLDEETAAELERRQPTPMVSRADALARQKQEGLEHHFKLPDQPEIRAPVLDLMIAHAHERQQYDAAVSRGPQGFLPDALGFVSEIGAGMIDPVNAAAFSIPVVGEARFGKMLASAGESLAARAGIRAGVGAAQGAVGTAVLQPAEWWLHTNDGQDFTMSEALRSVIMGAGMGGAFHAGFGAIGDVRARSRGLPLPGSPEDLLAKALLTGEPGAKAPSVMDRAGNRYEPLAPDLTNAGAPGEEIPGSAPSAAARPIFEGLRDQLIAAGRPEDEANQIAAVIAARYATRAQRLGRPDAEALAREAGIEIRPGGELAEEGRAYAQAARRRPLEGQMNLPGTEPITDAELAQRRADEALKPKAEQKPMDVGLFSDDAKQRSFFQRAPAPTFYSAVERAVTGAKQEKASPQQWLGMLRNAGGVKSEEMEWLGLEDWLKEQNGSVTKQEIADYIQANRIEVNEVTKGASTVTEEEVQEASRRRAEAERAFQATERGTPEAGAALDRYNEAADAETRLHDELVRGHNTRHGEHVLRGGKNYREMLLTLPEQVDPVVARAIEIAESENGRGSWEKIGGGGQEHYLRDARRELGRREEPGSSFRSSHWEEPNVLANVRFNDRTIDGKKTLFVEEVQSDWHQIGRKYGYKDGQPLTTRKQENSPHGDNVFEAVDSRGTVVGRGFSPDEALQAAKGMPGVPDAPFKTTWPELAMKRMIRYAAENGYEQVAWTTGETQAARYDLSRQIDFIDYRKNSDGTYTLGIVDKKGDGVQLPKSTMAASELDDVIGKEVAEKIRNDEGKTYRGHDGRRLENLDLKVGGEGMKGFYDQILPTTVNKLVKKFGGKVGRSEVEAQPVHTLPITDTLREAAVEQGFPLFQKGAEGEPQGRVTFADNKRIVELFKSANASTGVHELGHIWLEELIADAGRADAPRALKDDLTTVLKWLGVDRPEDIGTPHHEQFARGFEQYLRDGRAPSSALAAAFEKFKAWLTAIYRSLTELGAPISDDIRAVFDRILATDEQIAAARAHPAAVLADLPPRVREDALRATVADVTAGNTARTGEMLNEAAKEDPRIAESVADRSGTTTVKPFGNFAPESIRPDQRTQAARADWGRVADARRSDDEDLVEASKQAEKTPEPASIDPEKAPSAAEAAAREADALLAELLPRLTDDERRTFEDALNQLDQDKAAQEQIVRDGAACLAAAVA
jgi:hypothetical protein